MKKFTYSVILQKTDALKKNEVDLFEEYRAFIYSENQTILSELSKIKSDTIQKNGTILRGGLTHFLSTPLKSDKEDIIRLIEDSIENTVQQLDAAPNLSSVEHSLWKIIDPQNVPLHRQLVGVVKRLLKNGRAILNEAGCQFGKNSGETIISSFHFDGFSTAQSIKILIDRFTDQQPIGTIIGTLSSTITVIEEEDLENKFIVQIDFDLINSSILPMLNERIPILLDQFGIKNVKISKHSLHHGIGGEYQIQFSMDIEKYPVGTVIMSLVGDSEELEEAITVHGSLNILERL
jgi:hypothetical protein